MTDEHHDVQAAGDYNYNLLDLVPFYGHPLHTMINQLQHVSPSISRVARTAVDVHERSDSYIFRCDVPGLSREEVSVTVHDGNVLTISGERKLEHHLDNDTSKTESGRQQYRRVERQFGAFVRSFTMPRDADLDHIKATVNKGVLTVDVPKKEVPETDDSGRVTIEWSEL